jgi:hypothetical protein
VPLPERSQIACGSLSLAAESFSAKTGRMVLESGSMTLKGDRLSLSWRLFRLAARLTSAAFGSFLGRSTDLRLKVDRAADLEAGSLSVAAEGGLAARAESLDLRAKGAVIIDGQHLRLG